jgi:hypothetical protein
MECLLGLLKVKVVRGLNLAICDPLSHSSDPYVVIHLGQQVGISFFLVATYYRSCKNNGWSDKFRCECIPLLLQFFILNHVSLISPDNTFNSDIYYLSLEGSSCTIDPDQQNLYISFTCISFLVMCRK